MMLQSDEKSRAGKERRKTRTTKARASALAAIGCLVDAADGIITHVMRQRAAAVNHRVRIGGKSGIRIGLTGPSIAQLRLCLRRREVPMRPLREGWSGEQCNANG